MKKITGFDRIRKILLITLYSSSNLPLFWCRGCYFSDLFLKLNNIFHLPLDISLKTIIQLFLWEVSKISKCPFLHHLCLLFLYVVKLCQLTDGVWNFYLNFLICHFTHIEKFTLLFEHQWGRYRGFFWKNMKFIKFCQFSCSVL